MPRTKVSRTTKRNREAAYREGKVRDFETALDQYLTAMESKGTTFINEVIGELDIVRQRTSKHLLQMKVGDLLVTSNLNKICDWTLTPTASLSLSSSSMLIGGSTSKSSLMRSNSTKVSNPNDEGYLTEDSTNRSTDSAIHATMSMSKIRAQQQQRVGRTPGPLNSARARSARRSRSACNDFVPQSAQKPNPTHQYTAEHASRSKLRTPMSARPKAISADRTPMMNKKLLTSPATAFLRWPRPGELVLSACGSPVLAQVHPDKYANVNIPIGDGVLSLRPKKIGQMDARILESINPETLDQIKMLTANLNLIMTMADRAAAQF